MAEIININSENVIRLTNEQIVRPFTANWTKIRLGMRLRINASASISTPIVGYFGFCNFDGPGGYALDSDCQSFVGMRIRDDISWAYDTGNLCLENGRVYLSKKSGTTITDDGATSANFDITTNSTITNAWFLDIEKVDSSTLSIEFYYPDDDGSPVLTDVSESDFLETMERGVFGFFNSYGELSNASFAYNESTEGVLNAINVGWGQTETMDIASIAITKLK